ncbi:uncharacterized protein DSM5745_08015 [Aspergillus mulundensis]|uniref:Transcription factor domain-containing protein n=1 Tax=Aspergillus mulundensis TaxID=1810919 RepID=A0A3D8R9G3_9EURO|nr:hypothetical protein DSM5745_08015 [Aspergillus mulundensis]RDW70504.1 hypothetical protein DSM5745_08015 [Aspergillus mulundensis]
MLEVQGYSDPMTPRDALTEFLIENIGLLDLPAMTIGRRTPCLEIWFRCVMPLGRTGIEPTSGLPRTLLDIYSNIGSPSAETQFTLWTPGKAEIIIQYQYWEAYRLAGIIVARSLFYIDTWQGHTSSNGCSNRLALDDDIESLICRILACAKALRTAKEEDPFQNPLYHCILAPLFMAALSAPASSACRDPAAEEFKNFVDERNHPVDQALWGIVLEVWDRQRERPQCVPLSLANEFAQEMEIELHLY